MEPIGQKVLIPSSDEIVVAGDLDDNSLEKLETRIFDETLDGVLSELHVGEDLIDDFVDEIEGSYSLKSENLTKNQLDSKNTSSEITSKEMVVPNIALEVMEEILLSDDVSIVKNDTVQKNENLVPGKTEAKEFRIENNEKILEISDENIVAFNKKNDMDTEKYDVSENELQTFFHFTNRQVNSLDFSEEFKQDNVKKSVNEESQSLKSNSELLELESLESESSDLESFLPVKNKVEPDEEVVNPDFFKTNQEIIQPKSISKSEEKLNEAETVLNLNEPESGQSTIRQAYFKDRDQFVGQLKSDIEESNITEILKTVPIEDFEEKNSNLNKIALGELGKDNYTNINKGELSQNFENSRSISDFKIDGNLNKKESPRFTNNKSFENQKNSVNEILSEGDVIGNEVLEVSEDQKLTSKELGKGIVQATENKKVLDEGNSMFNGRVNVAPQDAENFKNLEGQAFAMKEKINDLSTPLTEKTIIKSEEQAFAMKEKINGLSVPLTEKNVSEEQEVALKEKLNEDFYGVDNKKVSKDQRVLAKGGGVSNFLGMERSLLDELPIPEEKMEIQDIKITEKDFSKEFSEKTSIETLKNPRNFSSQDSESIVNTKSFTESYNPIVINSNVDASNVSGVKVGDMSNSMTDHLRNADLPFNIEQIVSRVRILRGNGVEEMTLRLNPAELGQITLKIRQSGADLSIDMRVDNPQAKQLVESGFDSLRNRFLDNDFSYQDLALNVDINERDSQFGRERRNSEFEENLSSVARKKTEDIKQEEEKVNRNIVTDSGLNLYV